MQSSKRPISSKALCIALSASVLLLFTYTLVAEALNFYPITVLTPAKSRLSQRLLECSVLWAIFWMFQGWVLTALRRMWKSACWYWIIVVAPVALGVLSSLAQLRANFRSVSQLGIAKIVTSFDGAIVLIPFVQGIALGMILLVQAHAWRVLGRAGFCRCGYDLTGNLSGSCPECGAINRTPTALGSKVL